jgi:hypothetical protein
MTLNDILACVALGYIVLASSILLAIRKWRPGLIGLGEDLNDQRIDSVRLRLCPTCNKGRLEPKIYTKRKTRSALPLAAYKIFGPPDEFVCTTCGYKVEGSNFDDKYTLISFVSKIPTSKALSVIALFLFMFAVVFLIVNYLF